MVLGYRHFHKKIAKGKREFPSSGELLILPAFKITKHTQPWIPLSYCKQMVSILTEVFITTPAPKSHPIGNVIMPIHLKIEGFAWFERL